MREALGQPLQNISRELLNKVVSKEVARDLRKYKFNMATGKTPNKENNRRPFSAEKRSLSPTKRLNFGSPIAVVEDNGKSPNNPGMTRELRDIVKELESGVHDKLSMLKMVAVKCGEADTSYKKIRQLLVKGDVTSAEK